MTALTINGRFLGSVATGVQRVARSLTEALDRQAITGALQLEVVLPKGLDHGLRLNQTGVREVGRLRGLAWEQLELAGDQRSSNLVNLANAAPLTRRSAVTMIHDAQVYLSPKSYSPQFAQWYRFSLPRIAAHCHKLLTVSHYSKRMLAHFGVAAEERIEVLHNGADHVLKVEPRPEIIARLGLQKTPFVVAFASLQAHKNLGVLLQAMDEPIVRGLKLVVVGPVSGKRLGEAFGQPPPSNVVLAGRVSDGELRALLEAAVCLAFPSRTEGFGLPAVEAMVLGCPSVVSPGGALPEICGSAALYAAPDDPTQWAEIMRTLAASPDLRAAMSRRGREWAARYTWDAAGRRLAAILAEVGA